MLHIVYGIATLCTIIPISTSEQLDPSKLTYNFPSYTLNLKPQINETTSGGSGEASSTTGLSVSTSVTSSHTALPSETSSKSSSVSPVALNAEEIQKLGQILEQDKAVTASPKAPEATEQATASKADPNSAEINVTTTNSTNGISKNGSSTSTTSVPKAVSTTEETKTLVPKVVSPTEETKTFLDDFYKKNLSWLGDQYTLSIVVPVLGGFLFAMVIIVTIATFSCIRRRCRRRRHGKKILPETIRKMGPSDRARLLAETSDEEF